MISRRHVVVPLAGCKGAPIGFVAVTIEKMVVGSGETR